MKCELFSLYWALHGPLSRPYSKMVNTKAGFFVKRVKQFAWKLVWITLVPIVSIRFFLLEKNCVRKCHSINILFVGTNMTVSQSLLFKKRIRSRFKSGEYFDDLDTLTILSLSSRMTYPIIQFSVYIYMDYLPLCIVLKHSDLAFTTYRS